MSKELFRDFGMTSSVRRKVSPNLIPGPVRLGGAGEAPYVPQTGDVRITVTSDVRVTTSGDRRVIA